MYLVAVLGDGVTAKAVKKALPGLGLELCRVEIADIVVASPGIPPEQYPSCSVEIISEIEFAYRLFQMRGDCPTIVGVTGTNGKTTVTEMISYLCDIPAAGNIGEPLISFVETLKGDDAIVVELSSYQLEGCSSFRPDIAVMLNVSEDHLVRHKTMAQYAAAKSQICARQTADDVVIFNGEDEGSIGACEDAVSRKEMFSLKHKFVSKIQNASLIGDHNNLNGVVALMVAEELGFNVDRAADKLRTFRVSEHRLECVAEVNGIVYFNDSKATNPDAVLKALTAFKGSSVHLILSGEDKKVEMDSFLFKVSEIASSICVFGGLRSLVDTWGMANGKRIQGVASLDEAIEWATGEAEAGDVVLFSPSSSSFDLYDNYEDRGRSFKAAVMGL